MSTTFSATKRIGNNKNIQTLHSISFVNKLSSSLGDGDPDYRMQQGRTDACKNNKLTLERENVRGQDITSGMCA